ncbi:hypothetical protein B0H66DRAFT_225254 [Apodospora peruviana]|uniref:Ecp2 effector protein-like domain-containing protein n=1 Tax=Apodospora peruviana TaxID=516989 RepID=A0AAE0I3X3_9PEZI|nr:hypothetical protein B0H66DRAFT_225254 [Apodospora peruviana]
MKLSILATALVASSAAAVPTTGTRNILAARAPTCWTNSINGATTATSPLVADCQALADGDGNIASTWTPSEENNYSFAVEHGTCGFRGAWNATAGNSLPASQMTVSPGQVGNTLQNAINNLAEDGKVGANGAFACMIPGMTVKIGWVSYEIYTAA